MTTASASGIGASTPDLARHAGRRGTLVAMPPDTKQGLFLDANHPLALVDRIVRDILSESGGAPICSLWVAPACPLGPERLARAVLLQVLYALKCDEFLLEQLRYDLRFRWFVRLRPGEPVWTTCTYASARQVMLRSFPGRQLLCELLRNVRPIALSWPGYFSFDEDLVDGLQAEHRESPLDSINAHQRDLLRSAGFPECDTALDGRLTRAMELILMRLCEPGLSGDTVAAEMGMSRRALYYLFGAHGLTPSMVIRNIRLHHCKRLLEDPRHSNRKISAIALDYGFSSACTFSRTFKQRYGVGPIECRPDRRRRRPDHVTALRARVPSAQGFHPAEPAIT